MSEACSSSVFGLVDWDPCFRAQVINTYVPLVAVVISAAGWAAVVLTNKAARRTVLEREVAQLNPESSRFYGATSGHSSHEVNASTRVFQIENTVLVNVALSLREDLSSAAAALQREEQHRRERIIELVLLLVLLATYAMGVLTSSAEWERTWILFWVYVTAQAVVSVAMSRTFIKQKLALNAIGTVVALSNLRTSLVLPTSAATRGITLIQAVLTSALLAMTLLSPVSQRPPSRLRALQDTMRRCDRYDELRTAVPTPPRERDDEEIAPSYSRETEQPPPPPEQHASLLSRALFLFVQPAIWKHFFVPITLPAVPQLMAADSAAAVTAMFRTHNGPETHAPLWLRLLRHFSTLVWYQLATALIATLLTYAPVFFLSRLLNYFTRRAEGESVPTHMGILFAVAMFASQAFFSVSQSQALMTGRHVCIQLRALLTCEIISKTLRRGFGLSAAVEDTQKQSGRPSAATSDGEIMNLVSADVSRLSEFAAYTHFIILEQPLAIVVGVFYLIKLLGTSALVGLMLLVIAIPIQVYLTRLQAAVQERMLAATDKRLNLASEVLTCIKTVKFFAWEKPFEACMNDTRARELHILRLNVLFSILNNAIFIATPMLVALGTFGAHTLIFEKELSAQKAFSALALFNTLRRPMSDMPFLVHWALSAYVSVRRIGRFLDEPETPKYEQLLAASHEPDLVTPHDEIGFDHASFTYGDPNATDTNDRFTLANLNCRFPAGQLSIVLGPVGAGKTSLLLALLGELQGIEGCTYLPCPIARSRVQPDPVTGLTESTAYCPQSAWLLGTTVRENILFGSPYDEERYLEVLRACALEPDLDLLEFHDETEVGEKGTALSGGQKARIALARAFYSRARHVLIDDALSAVDAHTAQHLYEHCLRGPLAAGRTMVLVTHAVALTLPGAAYAVVMRDGHVTAQGNAQELLDAGQVPDLTAERPRIGSGTCPGRGHA